MSRPSASLPRVTQTRSQLTSSQRVSAHFQRDHINVTFINRTLLELFYFIIAVNILLCLIYKLNFIIGMYTQEKKPWYCLWFKASTGFPGIYPLQVNGNCWISTLKFLRDSLSKYQLQKSEAYIVKISILGSKISIPCTAQKIWTQHRSNAPSSNR